jgi:hypothetical protein
MDLAGITRFKTFTFEPQLTGDEDEAVHKVSVGESFYCSVPLTNHKLKF